MSEDTPLELTLKVTPQHVFQILRRLRECQMAVISTETDDHEFVIDEEVIAALAGGSLFDYLPPGGTYTPRSFR